MEDVPQTKRKFWVDWGNPREPEIREWAFPAHPDEVWKYPDPLTLTECKEEVYRHAKSEEAHWVKVKARIRALRVGDVDADVWRPKSMPTKNGIAAPDEGMENTSGEAK